MESPSYTITRGPGTVIGGNVYLLLALVRQAEAVKSTVFSPELWLYLNDDKLLTLA